MILEGVAVISSRYTYKYKYIFHKYMESSLNHK